jgi:hypothetical protein
VWTCRRRKSVRPFAALKCTMVCCISLLPLAVVLEWLLPPALCADPPSPALTLCVRARLPCHPLPPPAHPFLRRRSRPLQGRPQHPATEPCTPSQGTQSPLPVSSLHRVEPWSPAPVRAAVPAVPFSQGVVFVFVFVFPFLFCDALRSCNSHCWGCQQPLIPCPGPPGELPCCVIAKPSRTPPVFVGWMRGLMCESCCLGAFFFFFSLPA